MKRVILHVWRLFFCCWSLFFFSLLLPYVRSNREKDVLFDSHTTHSKEHTITLSSKAISITMSQLGLTAFLLRNEKIASANAAISNFLQPATAYLLSTGFPAWFVSDPWICFGLGPLLAVFFGASLTCIFCEWLTTIPLIRDNYLLTYSSRETRVDEVKKTQAVVPWSAQFWGTLKQIAGPSNLVGAVGQRFLWDWLRPAADNAPLPSLLDHCVDFYLLMLLADLFLYIGHRAQHGELGAYPWRWHSYHHTIKTPTAWSVAYIDQMDATLQSVIPLLVSQAVVRAHPLTSCCYLFFHLSTNCLNHAGIEWWVTNMLNLRFLPLRCSTSMHDAHHRYTAYAPDGSGKNFGEFVWLWDYIFGTYGKSGEVLAKRGRKPAERAGTPLKQ